VARGANLAHIELLHRPVQSISPCHATKPGDFEPRGGEGNHVKYPLIIILSLLTSLACAQMQTDTFESDSKVQQLAEANSINMVEVAKKFYGIELDWSDESIRHVERIAEQIYTEFKTTNPPPERIEAAYMLLGSYVGEVFRRNHGAEWGWVKLEGNRFVGMQGNPRLFWPWGKTQKRLINGSEDDLWLYCQWLVNQDATELKK
jgi:hypothetical protein